MSRSTNPDEEVSARLDGHGCVQLGIIDHRLWCSCILEVLGEWCWCREGLCCATCAKEVDSNNGLHLQAPGVLSLEALMAIDEMIVMGAQADPELLKAS